MNINPRGILTTSKPSKTCRMSNNESFILNMDPINNHSSELLLIKRIVYELIAPPCIDSVEESRHCYLLVSRLSKPNMPPPFRIASKKHAIYVKAIAEREQQLLSEIYR